MNSYKKVYAEVPYNQRDWSFSEDLCEYNIHVKEQDDVIVLNREELRELWDTAVGVGAAAVLGKSGGTHTFQEYLKSEGIE